LLDNKEKMEELAVNSGSQENRQPNQIKEGNTSRRLEEIASIKES
jgi:hypothetical protein